MKKFRVASGAALALWMVAASTVPAPAQVTPPPRPAPSEADPQKAALLEAQKAAFLTMSEADRKAAQDALGWLGLYNGAVDGAFGRRTLDSILAYQTSVKAPASGVVSSAQLAALKASAQKARATVGFQSLDDARTGIRIGAPLKFLEKRSTMASQTQLTNRDGSVSLDLIAPPGAQTLAALYGKLSAEAPARKIDYKAMKADSFFVVTGEQGAKKFYLRYAVAPATAPDPGVLRGFEFAYPDARAEELDRVALAIANSFEPFPSSPEPPKRPAEVVGAPVTPASPAPSPTPSEPVLTATALVVAPGQALTVLSEANCKSPTIGGKPVKFVRSEAGGLALLGGDFGGAGPSIRLGGPGAGDVVVLSLASVSGSSKAVLEVGDATLAPVSGAGKAIVMALSKSAQGAPAFDRQGALAAFVAPMSAEPKRRGGVVLAEPHDVLGAAAAEGMAIWSNASATPDLAPIGAAEIARRMRGAIMGVFCTQ